MDQICLPVLHFFILVTPTLPTRPNMQFLFFLWMSLRAALSGLAPSIQGSFSPLSSLPFISACLECIWPIEQIWLVHVGPVAGNRAVSHLITHPNALTPLHTPPLLAISTDTLNGKYTWLDITACAQCTLVLIWYEKAIDVV